MDHPEGYHPAKSPRPSPNPIGENQSTMNNRIETLGKPFVIRHLEQEGGCPDGDQQDSSQPNHPRRDRSGANPDQCQRSRRFDEHRRDHDQRSRLYVSLFVGGEKGTANRRKQWIVDNLHKPDDANHHNRRD